MFCGKQWYFLFNNIKARDFPVPVLCVWPRILRVVWASDVIRVRQSEMISGECQPIRAELGWSRPMRERRHRMAATSGALQRGIETNPVMIYTELQHCVLHKTNNNNTSLILCRRFFILVKSTIKASARTESVLKYTTLTAMTLDVILFSSITTLLLQPTSPGF